ncbi:SH3 domain-containing YSC84-like protein [Lachnellula hyalina]|uniref:SH3 domain-containing YSC84-like protein n=1 Tax=Lachnellula hyalina TaxID=1316788 RepID=A0A8H8QXY0_9HELO|nr:SH3 domain-containing YSC84-like protein [Lachnellula hyalina]TVY24170.1 SH3 domain-containing YSC84-like protein [Lachnellula hyalina]
MAEQQQQAHKSSAWEKAKHGGKATFDKGWAAFEKLGAPVNKLTNKIGSEAFWPTQLGPECDKAARILKSFCKDGFYTEQPTSKPGSPGTGPKTKPKVLVKIPQKVIQKCVGLAIFSTMRTGLWVSGAGGSGVLIARKEDGSWSPPSGILIHTLGVGWMAGIDIYDCVIVINDRKALGAFSKVRLSLGGEVSAVAGPVGTGGILESELLRHRKPVFSYMKSRGLYAGVQADGTIIVERYDENARFYGEKLHVGSILAGNVRNVPTETRLLMEVVKQAEGRTDVNPTILQQVDQYPVPSESAVEHNSNPTSEQQAHFAPPEGFYAPQTDYKHSSGAATAAQTSGSQTSYGPPAQAYPQSGYPADYKHPSGATAAESNHAAYPGGTQASGSEPYYPPPPPGPPPHTAQNTYPPPPQASNVHATQEGHATHTTEPQMFYPPPPQGSNFHAAQDPHAEPQMFYPPPPQGGPPSYS